MKAFKIALPLSRRKKQKMKAFKIALLLLLLALAADAGRYLFFPRVSTLASSAPRESALLSEPARETDRTGRKDGYPSRTDLAGLEAGKAKQPQNKLIKIKPAKTDPTTAREKQLTQISTAKEISPDKTLQATEAKQPATASEEQLTQIPAAKKISPDKALQAREIQVLRPEKMLPSP
jgi:hypothetical protein